MPNRFQSSGDYRYGFNGKEMDDEVKGSTGTQYDYGFRIYDPRIAKFLSVDPLTTEYPWYTPYQFAGNTPIMAIDLDGLEEFIVIQHLNKKGDAVRISVHRFVGSTGDPRNSQFKDTKGKLVTNQNVMVRTVFSDGTKETTYEDNLTSIQRDVANNNVTNRTPITENNPVSVNFPDIGQSKDFTDGTLVTSSANFDRTPTFNGKKLEKGTTLSNFRGSLNYFVGTLPFAEAGKLGSDIKESIKKLTKELNSAENIQSITVSITFPIGTTVPASGEIEANKQLGTVMNNIVKEFRKVGLSDKIGIKVGSIKTPRSETASGSFDGAGTKIKIN